MLKGYLGNKLFAGLMPINHEIDRCEALLGECLMKASKALEGKCAVPASDTSDGATHNAAKAIGNITASLKKLG